MSKSMLLALCTAIPLTFSCVSGLAQAQDQSQTIQSLLAEAGKAQAAGEFARAAEDYRKAVAVDPAIPELWANLGLMEHQTGDHLGAVKSFQQAARLKPSLFVPQLFLGLENLQLNKPDAALPWLENAVKLNPDDLQAALSLGKAYETLHQPGHAAISYLQATRIEPRNGNTWLQLGTAYLEQVDDDARVMTSSWSNSPYVKLRAAEALADEGKLGPAEDAFKSALNTPSPAPCVHSEFGAVLLHEGKLADARKQFNTETQSLPHCALASLGIAVANIVEGQPGPALTQLTPIASADPGFVASSLQLFRGAVSPQQLEQFLNIARSQKKADSRVDIASLVEREFTSPDAPVPSGVDPEDTAQGAVASPGAAEHLYTTGHFAQCSHTLKHSLTRLTRTQLQLAAICSFSTGDYSTTSMAAARLKADPTAKAEGLYWESKADEKLAVASLARAGAIAPDSPGLHLLMGNAFRQQRHWAEAEAEYRKALSRDPNSRPAQLSLAITLFTELKTEEALQIAKNILAQAPKDPEANLLAAEILVLDHRFQDAEPYLLNCRNLNSDLTPRVHVLLGRVYAETNRTSEAIAEYKLGVVLDEDGSLHYQLARLYRKAGVEAAAAEQMRLSKQLREKWDNQAHLDLGQPLAATGLQ